MTNILRGNYLADSMIENAQNRFEAIKEIGDTACFTTVLVGEDPASQKYVEMKQKEGVNLGVRMSRLDLPSDISQQELENEISRLNKTEVDAVLIQYPLPKNLDYAKAITRLNPLKDVDGLHPSNLGLLFHDPENYNGLLPCTPNGIIQLLKYGGVNIQNANVVVVGRGLTVGGPLSVLLAAKNNGVSATVSTLHHGTKLLKEYTLTADIIVGAAGSPDLITADMIKEGTTLVAVGVKYVDRKAKGDFTREARQLAGTYVPVTNGVGPMTRANLWQNVLSCYELNNGVQLGKVVN